MTSIIKGEHVRVEQASEGRSRARACTAKAAEPVRIDGRVQAIRFTCSCGEVSLIELDYEEAAAPQAS